MEKVITIDNLTIYSVTIKAQKTIMIEGEKYEAGLPNFRFYTNSVKGREELEKEVPTHYLNAIFSIWGDTPTIEGNPAS